MFEKRNKKKTATTKPAQAADAQLDDDLLASVAGGANKKTCTVCGGSGKCRFKEQEHPITGEVMPAFEHDCPYCHDTGKGS